MKLHRILPFAPLTLLILIMFPACAGLRVEEGMVQQSQFIFTGTVKELNATTMPGIPITDSMAIVTVGEILKASRGLADFTGRDVTVQMKKPGTVEVGEQMVFFTTGWLLGESIAVHEVDKLRLKRDSKKLRQQVDRISQSLADQELGKHIASAELVIVGKVSDFRETELTESQTQTEHDPRLWECVVEIESVEKGTFPQKSIIIIFSNSMDVMWFTAPKFHEGQEGIWILHKDQIEGIKMEGYTALHPLDFHPRHELDRIRRIVDRVQ